jgi:hypothetical protein
VRVKLPNGATLLCGATGQRIGQVHRDTARLLGQPVERVQVRPIRPWFLRRGWAA